MKSLIISAIALSSIAGAVLPAAAATPAWVPINARQASLDARIDQGIRSGRLTRLEASRLRAKIRDLENMEARYRRSGGGLSLSERRDLQHRMDQISNRITAQATDAQRR